MQKNTASQQFVVFAFNTTTNLPVTGDAANITATISKDFAADVATNDVNPTETQKGFYVFDATQSETNANDVQIFPSSVTASVQVISVPGLITTVPVSFGDDIIQTADHTAGIADIPTVAEFNARTIPSADYFDPAVDAVANVTTVATTTTNADMRGTNNALLAASYTAPDNAGITSNGSAIAALNNITAADVWSSITRTLTSGANIVLAKGVGVTGFNDITAASVLAAGDIDGYTLEESQKLVLAASAGILSGAATTTVTITAVDGSKARLTATVDGDGNRSAVIKDVTG